MAKSRTLSRAEAAQINQPCLIDKIRLLNRVLTNVYSKAVSPCGLTVSQLNIIGVVGRFGTATPGEIGDFLKMDKSSLSEAIAHLRNRDWLEVTHEAGGPPHFLRVTPEGSRVFRTALPRWEQAQSEAFTLLGQDGADVLTQVAGKIRFH